MTEEEIFQHARRIEDPAQRDRYLQVACRDEPQQLARIEKLLKIDREETHFLESPALETQTALASFSELSLGSQVGPYRLVELLGEGGFGLVYRAQQDSPVRRQVALKLIKPGMDSQQLLARFQVEQQALAMMNHPNIAAIFDCGHTPSGHPWFAMEYVPGSSITAYCDSQRLDIQKRLTLMLSVCSALEHAHQKGIIHRDLKPSNILASTTSISGSVAETQVKVIDFGIAKAMQGSMIDFPTITQGQCWIGTPLYMSPEQADGRQQDVDTRSDIYSMGTILYELITGKPPLARQQRVDSSIDQVLLAIRETEPTSLSHFFHQATDEAVSSAELRNSSPAAIASYCHRDLNWIVMKCLEKDRQRRYQSASELRGDLQQFLNGGIVQAGPPSALWQLRKMARRYRRTVLAGSAVLLSLIFGLAVSISQAIRATRAETIAQQERDQAIIERKRADDENQVAQAVTQFLIDDLLGQANIANQIDAEPRDPDIKARDLVDRASRKVGDRFQQQPSVEVSVRNTLSSAWLALGDTPAAVEQAREAVRLADSNFTQSDRPCLLARQVLAAALVEAGQAAEATELMAQVREHRLQTLGEDHLDTVQATNQLAKALDAAGKLQESEQLLKDGLVRMQVLLGADHDETLKIQHNLAVLWAKQGKFTEAQTAFRETVDRRIRSGGDDHPMTVRGLLSLASTLQLQEKFAEAEPIYEQADELAKRLLGQDHPVTLSIANDLANLYSSTGRVELAGELYEYVLQHQRRTQGEDNPAVWDAMNNLAIFYAERGKSEQALEMLTEVVQRRTTVHGSAHPDTILGNNNLAYLCQTVGKFDQAVSCYQAAIQGAQQTFPEDHPQVIVLKTNLAGLLMKTDQPHQAEPIYRELSRAILGRYGEISKEYASLLGRWALALHVQGKNTEAESIADKHWSVRMQLFPEQWTTAWAQSLLGRVQAALGKQTEAEDHLLSGANAIIEQMNQVPDSGRENAQQSIDWMVEFYEQTKDSAKADAWRARAVASQKNE